MKTKILRAGLLVVAVLAATARPALAQVVTKAQVGELIKAVENGVDEFRKYVERKGENAKDKAPAAQSRSGRRRNPSQATTENRKAQAEQGAERVDDALGDLNRSTNRLRRRFNKITNYLETKSEVQRVVDDGRQVNQLMLKGGYRSEMERAWATLRGAINQLARTYGIAPMGV